MSAVAARPIEQRWLALVVVFHHVLVGEVLLHVSNDGFAKRFRIYCRHRRAVHSSNCSLKPSMFSAVMAIASGDAVSKVEVRLKSSGLENGIALFILSSIAALVYPESFSW